MSRDTAALIDLAALRHNLNRVRELAPKQKVLALVKADAYGHGLIPAARALAGADCLGVAHLDEAFELRDSGVNTPLLILEGAFDTRELMQISQQQIRMVIHSLEQIDMLETTRISKPLSVWLKIDTGMNRLGVELKDVALCIERLQSSGKVADITLITHFACSDEPAHPLNKLQLERFLDVSAPYSFPRSMANSGGILFHPGSHFDWVRPGIILYGASPAGDSDGKKIGLKPVMTVRSEIIAIRQVSAGEPVGYGCHWVAERDSVIGVVAIGYGDGYPRHAENGTPVLVNGKLVPLVGRVSMDMITVDLTDLQQSVKVGDPAVLWGDGLPVEEIAKYTDTICYELLCQMTRRVNRVYLDVDNGAAVADESTVFASAV
ncbi:MAG TPA: alanine racemase [Pseudomonadales bacterium]|nr:alanine racemase [Pseudomonadales bacterium]